MEIKDFVKSVLLQIDRAVDEARGETSRDITFTANEGKRTIEFDIAVSAEDTTGASGKAGIKVISIAEAGGNISTNTKNASVSRIQFGLHISPNTKTEEQHFRDQARIRNQYSENI